MGIPLLVRQHLYTETTPSYLLPVSEIILTLQLFNFNLLLEHGTFLSNWYIALFFICFTSLISKDTNWFKNIWIHVIKVDIKIRLEVDMGSWGEHTFYYQVKSGAWCLPIKWLDISTAGAQNVIHHQMLSKCQTVRRNPLGIDLNPLGRFIRTIA